MALVLAMLRPMLPVTVRAADGGGTCGAGAAWAFDADTGVLAVPGAGCLAPEEGRKSPENFRRSICKPCPPML